jgi:DNA-directed RNA polymerase subunit M/transcription elongation factor TFIIS
MITSEQVEEIKKKRLSGNYTLEEIGQKYGITRERVRQLVGVPKLQKSVIKKCINCGKTFFIHGKERSLCSVKCKPPHKERPCIDCQELFTPKKQASQFVRCASCYLKYRANEIRKYQKKYRAKLKQLGVS